MSNSVRTPRQGKTAASRRIAEAVDDEDWQKFRLLLKGYPTRGKLNKLQDYYVGTHRGQEPHVGNVDIQECDYCIRIDNYIKALCRGGQLYPGESLLSVINLDWKPSIKS